MFIISSFFCSSLFSYKIKPEYIDIEELPDIKLRLSVKTNHGYVNTLSKDSFSFKIDNSEVSAKSFFKSTYPEHRFYMLFIIDEGLNMRGTPVASSKRISYKILEAMSTEDMAAFVGINSEGMRIVDFTSDRDTIFNTVESIKPSRHIYSEISGEILRRINIFQKQIYDKGLKGAVFVFSNTISFDYDISYDISKKYPYVYIFNFSPSETTGQIISENFFYNPDYNLDIGNSLDKLLEYRPCFYDFILKSGTGFDNQAHRLTVSADIIPMDSLNYSFTADSELDKENPDSIAGAFHLNRFLMYLSLISGLNVFIFFVIRLLKDFPSKIHKSRFWMGFIFGQIIASALAFVISIIY